MHGFFVYPQLFEFVVLPFLDVKEHHKLAVICKDVLKIIGVPSRILTTFHPRPGGWNKGICFSCAVHPQSLAKFVQYAAGVKEICFQCEHMPHFCSRKLDLSPLSFLSTLQNLTVLNCSGVQPLILPHLKTLDLRFLNLDVDLAEHHGVATDTLILNFCNLKNLKRFNAPLRKLDLCGCTQLRHFDAHQPSLQELGLSFCTTLSTLDGVLRCTHLISLDLSYCCSVRDIFLLGNLTHLQDLNLSHCCNIDIKRKMKALILCHPKNIFFV